MGGMISVADLSFGHGRRQVGRLDRLDIPAGKVTVILGPNGVGKTTLFRTLLGLQKALAGTILVDGADLARRSRREIARTVAYVPQAHSAAFAFAVMDVVLMGRASRLPVFDAPGRQDREAARAALDALGVASLAHRPYTEISGGERQLVLIARALAQETPYLVLDEPTSSLDYGNQYRMLDLISGLARDGKGVILSTHQPDHALRIADQVVLMVTGDRIVTGPPAEVLVPERLKAAYGLEVAIRPLSDLGQDVIVPLGHPRRPWQAAASGRVE